ncbi:hypothetical protein EJD97_009984 [Solanum chilense]|uniref:Uncharacterized protein n=1 Tax=Solanum chilense TaxID=4083 RepID=A0A6N2CDL7_SOLCI|nr:hypothetical protein EJD97_009984 [Solanum chilense]
MNMSRNVGGQIGGGVGGVNQIPPQTSAVEMEMPVNPTSLTDGAVSTPLVEIAQAITLQAQAMTAQAEQQGFARKDPLDSTMASRSMDFTMINPPSYTGSKIS